MKTKNTSLSSFLTTNQFHRNVIKLILRKREFGSFIILCSEGVKRKRFMSYITCAMCLVYAVVESLWHFEGFEDFCKLCWLKFTVYTYFKVVIAFTNYINYTKYSKPFIKFHCIFYLFLFALQSLWIVVELLKFVT